MRRARRVLVLAGAIAVGLLWSASPSYAAGETFQVFKVTATGCTSGAFGMLVERAGLDGGTYSVRTFVTVDGLVYMNEEAAISVNSTTGWNLFNNFTYGAVPNPGTWPIPTDRQLRMDFTLERPKGTVLYAWSTVVDGCNTGGILYNGLTANDKDKDLVPIPRDRCPKLKATTPDGCPARSLTIAYDGANDRFIGWLYAKGFPKLYRGRAVTIWKVRPGPDKRIGSTKTTKRGNYALARDPGKGTYYAVSGAVGNVAKETSLKLKLR